MVRPRKIWDDSSYVTGHSEQFKELLRFCEALPLGASGDACQVYKAESVGSGQIYAVKMYKPYSREQMARDRSRLRRKGYSLSDKALENYFHPWHRESRAYEQIDLCIPQPKRQFFPKYYGTALIPVSSVPAHWTRTMTYEEQIPAVVLEFFDSSSNNNEEFDLHIGEESLTKATALHTQFGDGPVHVYIHFMEVLETLHAAKIIHGDLKSDAFTDYILTGRVLMFDFSLSWVSVDGLPCLDPFRKIPKSFGYQTRRECKDIEYMISTDYDTLPNKIPCLDSCTNCVATMKRICNGLHIPADTDRG